MLLALALVLIVSGSSTTASQMGLLAESPEDYLSEMDDPRSDDEMSEYCKRCRKKPTWDCIQHCDILGQRGTAFEALNAREGMESNPQALASYSYCDAGMRMRCSNCPDLTTCSATGQACWSD